MATLQSSEHKAEPNSHPSPHTSSSFKSDSIVDATGDSGSPSHREHHLKPRPSLAEASSTSTHLRVRSSGDITDRPAINVESVRPRASSRGASSRGASPSPFPGPLRPNAKQTVDIRSPSSTLKGPDHTSGRFWISDGDERSKSSDEEASFTNYSEFDKFIHVISPDDNVPDSDHLRSQIDNRTKSNEHLSRKDIELDAAGQARHEQTSRVDAHEAEKSEQSPASTSKSTSSPDTLARKSLPFTSCLKVDLEIRSILEGLPLQLYVYILSSPSTGLFRICISDVISSDRVLAGQKCKPPDLKVYGRSSAHTHPAYTEKAVELVHAEFAPFAVDCYLCNTKHDSWYKVPVRAIAKSFSRWYRFLNSGLRCVDGKILDNVGSFLPKEGSTLAEPSMDEWKAFRNGDWDVYDAIHSERYRIWLRQS